MKHLQRAFEVLVSARFSHVCEKMNGLRNLIGREEAGRNAALEIATSYVNVHNLPLHWS